VPPAGTVEIGQERIGKGSIGWNRTLLDTWNTIHPSNNEISTVCAAVTLDEIKQLIRDILHDSHVIMIKDRSITY
jgi:hypothetical protein